MEWTAKVPLFARCTTKKVLVDETRSKRKKKINTQSRPICPGILRSESEDGTIIVERIICIFQSVVFVDAEKCTCSIVNPTDASAPPKTFAFDGVYGPESSTEQLYNDIAYPFVEVSTRHETVSKVFKRV